MSTLDAIHFEKPHDLAEACALVASLVQEKKPFHVLGGGTDLVVESHLGAKSKDVPPGRTVVDVSSLLELATIDDRGARIRLGGGVTYLTLRRHADLVTRIPMLAAMAKDVGAIQIQARGTLAGNLATASPAADGVCALMALDATVGLISAAGEREVPLEGFYTGYKKTQRRPDELIAWVEVRVPQPHAHWIWRKVGTRLAQAISKVALAGIVETEGPGKTKVTHARFGMASIGPVTSALPSVRAAIEGKTIDLAAVEKAVDADISPIDDVRSTGEYRRHVARAVVREFLRAIA
ncbi:MAG: FAD binding domain-containing protein [Polyangiales bacterium]